MLCDKFCWNWPFGSKGEDNMWKVDEDNGDEHQRKFTLAFDSDEVKEDSAPGI